MQSTLPAELKKQNPDYKRAAEAARTKLGDLSRNIQGMIDGFKKAKEDLTPALADLEKAAATQPASQPSGDRENAETFRVFLGYADNSVPRYEKIKKLADDLISRLGNLGELKQLDELRDKKTDSIVVMGEKDMVVIPRERVWRAPIKALRTDADSDKVRFAGEQEISTALVVLTAAQRPTVVFVRNGGLPLGLRIEEASYFGPYSEVAEKLREYNFEVLENDLSGQWPLFEQQLHQQFPAVKVPAEATEEQMRRAAWIVRAGRDPSEAQQQQGMPPSAIGPKLAQHLAGGGSALILFGIQDDTLTTTLSPFGITAQTGMVAFHDRQPEVEGRVNDQIDNARRTNQALWVLNEYGHHPVTDSLQSLDSVLLPVVPILRLETKGITSASILPLKEGNLTVYAKEIRHIRSRNVTLDPVSDMQSPIYAGVAAEKAIEKKTVNGAEQTTGGNRLVVVGCSEMPDNQYITMREKDVQRGGSNAPRFPGNAEFMTNSVFWLSKMEKMMSIAPASREVALIAPLNPGTLTFWRVMVLCFVPVVVLLIGGRIYFARRD